MEYEVYHILKARVLRLFGHTSSPTPEDEKTVVRMNELIGL